MLDSFVVSVRSEVVLKRILGRLQIFLFTTLAVYRVGVHHDPQRSVYINPRLEPLFLRFSFTVGWRCIVAVARVCRESLEKIF